MGPLKHLCWMGGAGLLALAACQPQMENRGRFKPYEKVPPVHILADAIPWTKEAPSSPPTLDRPLLDKGQKLYAIHCAICHDPQGGGQGFVTERGYPVSPSFHLSSVRALPLKSYVEIMRDGRGLMPSFSWQLRPRERWAVAAYIRALQLSAAPAEAR